MTTNRTTLSVLAACVLLAITLAGAATAEELVIPISQPDQPVHLSLSATFGTVTVEGYDGREVRVEATTDPDEEPTRAKKEAPPGMRRIPNNSFGLTAEEENNRVTVHLGGFQPQQLHVLVPRATSLTLATVNGGELTVRGVHGEHELSNVNGGIRAENVSGTVVAQTTNGGVVVTFDHADPGKAMSFATLNGNVEVTFPADFGADLSMQTTNGEIFTDFEFTPGKNAPEVRQNREGGRYRVEVKREVTGSINGGGGEIRLTTFNGDILVHKGG